MKRNLTTAVSVLLATAVLSACGGGGSAPLVGVNSDTTVAASPTTTAALTNTPFTYSSGVSEFGTTSATTVQFTSTAASPAFSISTSTGTATGITTFGSCHFAVTAISGTVGSLKVGDTIVVNPCNMSVGTAGAVANGVPTSRSVALVMGAAHSANASVTVGVGAGGQLLLNGSMVGTVTVAPITGS